MQKFYEEGKHGYTHGELKIHVGELSLVCVSLIDVQHRAQIYELLLLELQVGKEWT